MDSGMKELFQNLDSLPDKVEKKLFRKGLRDIGDELVTEAKTLAPVRTEFGGKLRDSINKLVKQVKKQGSINLQVGTGVFYARFVEMGFMHYGKSTRTHVPARPFLTPVLESAYSKVMAQMSAFLQSEIPKEMAKSAKKWVKGK